jgi:serine/threonine-protein kinase
MKQSFDFSFLQKYGKVFKVFDEQDSGNICFGVENDGQRYFIKFAGAPTACGDGDTVAAVERLKATVPVYQDLRHKNLIEYISSEEIGGGFAMVFRWTDARCMGRMYPNARKRFLELSLAEREDVFREIMEFMTYTASKGYLAVDFYDGSIMYDFEQKKTIICDIDFFRKFPTKNDMGRMWGSSLFMAPEEYQLGADLDEVTNVYTLGAVAFALFSDFDRSQEKWRLSATRYQTVTKATNPDRSKRQQTIRQFMEEWEYNF